MLIIRLQRVGKTKNPTYRFIISEKARDTKGTYLELLGSYNPNEKENKIIAKEDRIKYWLAKGAQMSATVNNLFVKNGIITGTKKKSVYMSQDRKKKMSDKSAAKKDAADKKAAADKAAAEAKAAPVEAPQAPASAEATAGKEAPAA